MPFAAALAHVFIHGTQTTAPALAAITARAGLPELDMVYMPGKRRSRK